MKQYIEVFDDFRATIEYIESTCGAKLDEKQMIEALDKIALAHFLVLTHAEMTTFIQNYRLAEKQAEKE